MRLPKRAMANFSANQYVGHRRLLGALVSVVTLLSVYTLSAHAGPGAETYNEFLEKEVIYPDEEWQDYITEVGERLLAVSPHAGHTYTFVVVDQSIVNAWATPDAYIFMTRGILAHFNSEDEMAAVLGHEIGHVVGEHSKKSIGKARMGELLGWFGMFATGSSSVHGLANTLTQASLAGHGRAHELEADELGTEYVIRAGYNPRALLDSIQILRDHDNFQKTVMNRPTMYHGTFGSHPAHNKRLHELVEQSQHIFPEEISEPERDFHEMLAGLNFGDEPATGVVQDGKYFHGTLRLVLTFPEGWNVRARTGEIVAKDGQGTSDGEIGVKRQSPPDEPVTPLGYLTETLRRDDLEDGEEIQIGNYPGYIASVEVASGDAQKRMIAVVYKDGGVYLFNGELGPTGDPEEFARQFRETVFSFRAMTAADVRLINNQRIKLIVAKPGDTYAKLAVDVPLQAHGEETLRVINGHHPRGEPRAGDLIKVIE